MGVGVCGRGGLLNACVRGVKIQSPPACLQTEMLLPLSFVRAVNHIANVFINTCFVRVARFHKRANGDPEISHVVYKAEDHQRLQNEGQNDGNDDYPVYGEDDNEMKDLNVPARPCV